eukprot:SAG31_NODE_19686_length_594_cov_1.426263_1_plen_70_part_01
MGNLNLACLIFFTFELTVKLAALGPRSFVLNYWNQFDLVIVGVSWAAEVAFTNVSGLQAMRAFKASRVVL